MRCVFLGTTRGPTDAATEEERLDPEARIMNVSALADRWWMLVVRGIAAILFGFITIAAPRISLFALVILWGTYAIVDGVVGLLLAARREARGASWGWLLFSGIVSIAAGLLAFAWPGITAMILLSVIASWAVVTGVAEIATAIRLRRDMRGEWLLAAAGVLSIVFGILLVAFPRTGALAVAWMIGGYAVLFGALLIGLGLRLDRWRRRRRPIVPVGDEAAPA
jgi:uncharacterized membrane protein HdeD (DUF308 family)